MKNKQSRRSKWLIIAMLMAAMLLGALFTEVVMAQEADKKITGLGTGAITNPVKPANRNSAWSGSYVYYGKYDSNNPTKYRVLDKDSKDFGVSDGSLLLDCNSILYYEIFDNSKNWQWSNSAVRSGLNGDSFLNKSGNFTSVEKNAIASSKKAKKVSADGKGWAALDWVPLSGEQVFLLDAKEATRFSYGFSPNSLKDGEESCKNRVKTGSGYGEWWLRSSFYDKNVDKRYYTGTVWLDGSLMFGEGLGYYNSDYPKTGVSPAFNVKLSSVLFSSLIQSSESSPAAGKAGAEYKLTLKDSDLSVSAGEVTVVDGRTFSIPYTITDNSTTADPTQVSVVVTSGKWSESGWSSGAKLLQYARLTESSPGTSGTVKFSLDSSITGVWGTDYHIYILAEDVNGGKETDYSSAPAVVAISHSFTYTAGTDEKANTITATCTDPECPRGYHTSGITLTLNAPTELVYDGTTREATVTGYPSTVPVNLAPAPTITYYTSTGEGRTTASDTALSEAPIEAGNYVAQMTWGEQTASVGFAILEPHIHNDITFEPWTKTDSLPTSGNWYLVNDVNNNTRIPIALTDHVNLCFNGKKVTTQYLAVSAVGGNYSMTVWDDEDKKGCLENTTYYTSHTIGGGAHFILNNITVNGSFSIGKNGNVTMNSGSIQNSGSAVSVGLNGKFTMNDGTISCPGSGNGSIGIKMLDNSSCDVTVQGGTISNFDYGIYFFDGVLNIKGGIITQNKIGIAFGRADGLPHNGVLNLEGGSITGNGGDYTGDNVGGVLVRGGTFKLSGNPVIENNTKNGGAAANLVLSKDMKANIAGKLTNSKKIGVTYLSDKPYTFTNGYKATMGGNAPSAYFSSDDPDYAVFWDAQGEVMLTPKNCNITFYGNMEGTATIGDSQSIEIGTPLNQITKPADPSKDGFFFAGWTTEKASDTNLGYDYRQAMPDEDNGEGDPKDIRVDFSKGVVTGNMKLYPMFIKDRLEVHLDLGAYDQVCATQGYTWYVEKNYKSGASNAEMDDAQSRQFTVNVDEKIRMLYEDQNGQIDADKGMLKATRPGYELAGWYTKNGILWNGTGWKNATTKDSWWPMTPEYADSNTLKKHDSRPYNYYTVTLTAHWNPKEVNVQYVLDGGTADTSAGSQTTKLGSTLTLPGAPTKQTFRFTGWKIGNHETLYSAGAIIEFNDWSLTGQDGTLTVTAQYITDTTKHITFDTHGGTAIKPITADSGTSITISVSVKDGTAVSRTGYRFEGWYENYDTSSGEYSSPVSTWPEIMPDGDKIYHAKWTANTYTISFNMAGATTAQIEPKVIASGSSLTSDTNDLTIYNKDGNSAPTKTHYTFQGWRPAIPDTMPAYDLTVEAIWEPNSYTMNFVAYEGAAQSSVNGKYGDLVTPPDPGTRPNLEFVGWSMSSPIYMQVGTNDQILTITGKWKPSPDHTDESVLDMKDGKITGVTAEMEYKRVSERTWTQVPQNCTEITGLSGGEYQIRFASASEYKSNEITIVTIETGKPIPVSFNSNGGSDVPDQGVKYNGIIDRLEDPVRKFYIFEGWYIDDTTPWDFDKGVVTEAVTLKAHWQEPEAIAPDVYVDGASVPYGCDAKVSVAVWVAEYHTPSYQWYSCDADGGNGVQIDGATGFEYTIPAGENAGKVLYYYCEVTATREDGKKATVNSDVARVKVDKAESIPAKVTAIDRIYDGNEEPLVTVDNAVVGGSMYYASGDENGPTGAYTEFIPTGIDVGTYYVWYEVVGDENHTDSEARSVKVTINEGHSIPATVTANDRTYDDSAEPLVIVTGTATGGEMYYALGTATEATNPYRTVIPEKSDAGTYYVWYKVVGDLFYIDSDEKCVEVKISLDSTVSFDADNGTDLIQVSVKSGECVERPEDPVKAGYRFIGWFDGENEYDFTKAVEKNLTLVAHWEQESTPEPGPEEPQKSTKEAEEAILQATGDQDISGATFYKLQARQEIATKNAITIRWKRVPGAANYTIYAARCGQKMKKVAKVRGSKTSYTKKKLQPGKYYKFIVVANGNGKALAVSKTLHIATAGGSVGNILKLKASVQKVSLKAGKSITIKVKSTKSGVVKKHRNVLLESAKPSVAKVSKGGKITAVSKGSCYVYVYAQNGIFSKIKVTVK